MGRMIGRQDRKAVVRILADKELSTRQIAEITGWSQTTVVADLGERNRSESERKRSTTGGRKAARAAIAAAAQEHGTTEPPDGKYRIIYADPPWKYGNTQPDYHTEQRDHYPVMALADICALPVHSIAP
jgi:hypothetical protein